MKCHIVFEIINGGFRCKAGLVASNSNYYICKHCVKRDSQNSFDDYHPHDLQVKLGDILDANFQAPITEKELIILFLEYSKDASKTAVAVKALYGLKPAAAAIRRHLATCIKSTGHDFCKAI